MAKKGLFISKVAIEEIIRDFCNCEDLVSKEMNVTNHQNRYSLSKDNINFTIDVYYRNDNTCTITSLGTNEIKELSDELKNLIENKVNYREPSIANFSANISSECFTELINNTKLQPNVVVTEDHDKGDNGRIVKFLTNFGDKATLTFYQSSGKMRFQGFMMDLYVYIKTYIIPFTLENPSMKDVSVTKITTTTDISNDVNDFISNYIPNYYSGTNDIAKSFLEDSVKLLKLNDTLNDYSVWTFPILKVLEHRLKEILGFNAIIIDDKKGFRIPPEFSVNIFSKDNKLNKHVINKNLTIKSSHIPCLETGYNFLNENRHQLFHANQLIIGSRLIPTPIEAQSIIIDICKILENSYIIISK